MVLFNLRRMWSVLTLRGGVFSEMREDRRVFAESLVVVLLSYSLFYFYSLLEFPSLFLVLLFLAPMFWFIWAVVFYVLAKILGGGGSFYAYVSAVGYCHLPLVFGVIPVFGHFVGLMWAVVCVLFATKEVHGFSFWRAAFVVLVPVLFVVGLFVLFTLMVGVEESVLYSRNLSVA